MEKKVLRPKMLQRRSQINASERRLAAQRLVKFAASIKANAVSCIGGYVPTKDEIDPSILLKALNDYGIDLALPYVVNKEIMVFRNYQIGDQLSIGPFNIKQPNSNKPLCTPDVLLVPLLGFDAENNRLGYGGGYYDRYIASQAKQGKKPYLYGLAFNCQRVPLLKIEAHDIRLDKILAV